MDTYSEFRFWLLPVRCTNSGCNRLLGNLQGPIEMLRDAGVDWPTIFVQLKIDKWCCRLSARSASPHYYNQLPTNDMSINDMGKTETSVWTNWLPGTITTYPVHSRVYEIRTTGVAFVGYTPKCLKTVHEADKQVKHTLTGPENQNHTMLQDKHLEAIRSVQNFSSFSRRS